MNETQQATLLAGMEAGDRRSLARLISVVENGSPGASACLARIYPQTGRAFRLGFTGPPGAGKSTLIDALVQRLRADSKSVGVVAVDPSSPFTGGALLGDRVRLSATTPDDGVFFRSMATRGSIGGLAATTSEVSDVLDAYGMEVILLETVGVGQIELDVVAASECTVVVLVPESGDEVQAMKAGLMEIGDIFVLNKSDREGADRAMRELESGLELRSSRDSSWRPLLVKTVAATGEGTAELLAAVERFRKHQKDTGEGNARRRRVLREKIRAAAERSLRHELWTASGRGSLEDAVDQVLSGDGNPYELAAAMARRFAMNRGTSEREREG
ncbi:MAG: methylmalonyl Co-A mutase-associated GTPase MeaB [Gemmatimonadota bacterium]|nr:methylmalonyl Co-A mutase-associated GTPase MeaB [Gemmatimonadota bacterium]MDP6528282.1 methylmalonyl Co-A mutase-associated GTPase MeaB [Gemmatimonadota bacterium]MDP6803366.1 methylmalonyl Co-A mutase-associated GTPase MeaB [Gemmatimonadota bacterium]